MSDKVLMSLIFLIAMMVYGLYMIFIQGPADAKQKKKLDQLNQNKIAYLYLAKNLSLTSVNGEIGIAYLEDQSLVIPNFTGVKVEAGLSVLCVNYTSPNNIGTVYTFEEIFNTVLEPAKAYLIRYRVVDKEEIQITLDQYEGEFKYVDFASRIN